MSGRILLEKGVVTFLDVLGWKGIWQRKSSPINDLEGIVEGLKKEVEKQKNLLRGKTSIGDSSEKSAGDTKIILISDTILIMSEANLNTAPDIIEKHGALCKKIIPISIKNGLPLRGATCFGDIATNESSNVYAGSAIDEAASWHELADWIGVFMSPSARFVYHTGKQSSPWVKNQPPLKNNLKFDTYAVDWTTQQDEFLLDVEKDFLQMAPIFPAVISKYSNTLAFLESQIKKSQVSDESSSDENKGGVSKDGND